LSESKKLIIITGGAQGLGKEIASTLHNSGKHELVLVDINEELLKKTSQDLGCSFYVCDVSNYSQVSALIKVIIEEHGPIDVLLNNAGVMITGPLEGYSPENIKKTFDVNTLGPIYMSHAAVPHMKEKKSGIILNVVSTAGIVAKAERTIYNASKHALAGFTDCLRDELAPFGISVLGIYPSLINTDLFKNAGFDRDMHDSLEPADVAKVVEFMLSFDKMQLTQVVLKDINHQ